MKLSTIAKVLARQSPEEYQAAVKMCEPMLSQPALIPQIYTRIKEMHPELDRTDESILFAATVYQAYAPAALLGSGIERAPNGVRKAMCKVMGWNDAPVCNYYCSIAQAYCKNPKFKERVSAVLVGFEQFSVRSQQSE